ncbi:hypothetical protein KHP62_01145 [Rhodobacteraceae bacterium NNCM2]|nr:hypothetical protein [Coraliihabitans acroporae]
MTHPLKKLIFAAPLALAFTGFAASADEPKTACAGVGLDDDVSVQNFPHSLRVIHALKDGSYISGAETRISKGGELVVAVTCEGPWTLVDLPAGTYQVDGLFGEVTAKGTVKVDAKGNAEDLYLHY